MRRTIVLVFAIGIMAASATALGLGRPLFNWVEKSHDFGQIKMGQPVSHKFIFSNNGDSPLVLSTVKPSCGCTVTDFTKDPISPGDQGYVLATYNAAKAGPFTKTISVLANTNESVVVLTIRGEVIE